MDSDIPSFEQNSFTFNPDARCLLYRSWNFASLSILFLARKILALCFYAKMYLTVCLHFNSQKLFARLKMSKADGSYYKEINKIEKQDLLILDDFGLLPMDSYNCSILMEIIED